MKNRVKLIVALLASVLVVCGMFTLTSFAEDKTPAPAHTHAWSLHSSSGGNHLQFTCTPECKEFNKWIVVELTAPDSVYDGEAYDEELAFKITENLNATAPELALGTPVYNTPDHKAPTEAGEYAVTVPLLNGKTEIGTMTASFRIREFYVALSEEYLPGQNISGEEGIRDKGQVHGDPIDEEKASVVYEFLNLDKRNSKYTLDTPDTVGDYRAKATLYKAVYDEEGKIAGAEAVAVAYDEFKIRKAVKEDVSLDVYLIKDPKALLKIDPDAVRFNDYNQYKEVVGKLVEEGYLQEGTSNAVYGDAVLFVPIFGEGDKVVYSPKLYGLKTVKYRERHIYKPYVAGLTKPSADTTNDMVVTIQASRNNEKIAVEPQRVLFGTADPKVTVKPAARENLVFTDRYQKLVTPGSAIGGTIEYTVVNDENSDLTLSTLKWSKNVPTAIKAGKYYVGYRIKAANGNYHDIAGGIIEVSIAAEASDESAQPADDEEEEFDWLAPDKVTRLSVTKRGRKSVNFRFRRVSDATYYEYKITDKKGKTVVESTADTAIGQKVSRYIHSGKITGLKGNTWYKVKVRAVYVENTEDDGGKAITVPHFGDWSKTVKFRTK
ncbi:MAG: fibronectin type III domain-containing protein [Mogibacterium sp.]|nr:fibronectin type III domain-containing protein [Mogibacterium sp.]